MKTNMPKPYQTIILFCSILFLSISFAQQSPRITSTSKFFTVHVDEIEPAFKDRFEELNATQMKTKNQIYKEYSIDIPPSFSYTASGGKYITLRPRVSYSELDQSPKFSDKVKKLIAEKVNPYSDTLHEMLRFHHNEIWSIDTSLCYLPKLIDSAKLTLGHMRVDMVIPRMNQVYDSVMALFIQALKKVDSPMLLVAFHSSYGNGSNIYIYHVNSIEEISDARNPKSFLIKAFGQEEAKKITQRWYQCLFSYDAMDANPRPDLTDLQPGVTWLGVGGK